MNLVNDEKNGEYHDQEIWNLSRQLVVDDHDEAWWIFHGSTIDEEDQHGWWCVIVVKRGVNTQTMKTIAGSR